MDPRSDSDSAKREKCANHPWGFVADDVEDAPPCIAKCRQMFLSEVLPKHETLERVCGILEDFGRVTSEEVLHAMYCCDAQLCGVNHMQTTGKDPNINWLVSWCQNVGYDSVKDPGPPDSAYTCGQGKGYMSGPWCQHDISTDLPTNLSSSGSSFILSGPSRAVGITSELRPAASLTSTDSLQLSTPNSTAPQETAAIMTSIHVSDTQSNGGQHRGISTGLKITIGLVTAVVVAVTAVLLFCFLRKRRIHKRNLNRQTRQLLSPAPPPPPPPTRSLAAVLTQPSSHHEANAIPLTPPARLRERRLLPSSLLTTQPSPVGISVEHYEFPLSPVTSPMTSRLSPRHERTLKRKNGSSPLATPPSGPIWSTPDSKAKTPAQRTNNKISDSPMSIGTGNSATSSGTPSPTRATRLGDYSRNITELISPGPPPTRALPSTPPAGMRSLTTSPSSHKAKFSISPGASLASPSQDSVLSPDLGISPRASTDHARDLRNSW
ncbi:hypothetical protein BGZ63DRAFT_432527 [Mariannaea sp. PMI_226]|nr:hypothetical protein BGZ63DRAFT_432527 [Mariannaea sp. PMI_226]